MRFLEIKLSFMILMEILKIQLMYFRLKVILLFSSRLWKRGHNTNSEQLTSEYTN